MIQSITIWVLCCDIEASHEADVYNNAVKQLSELGFTYESAVEELKRRKVI